MGKKKPIVTPFGQWAYPGEITIIPSNNITMKGVDYPVMGIDNLGNSELMLPGQDYTFPGDYVTEIPQMGKGGLTQWFAEEWTDVKTGKTCGRSGKEKGSRPYPACRPKKRVNETTPKTTSEMSSAEKAKFKREKTSGKRIDYNHKRSQYGGENAFKTNLNFQDELNFQTFYKTLPSNLQVDDKSYDIRGYWDSLGRPNQFDYYQPMEDDGFYHAYSRHPKSGKMFKAINHPTAKLAIEGNKAAGYTHALDPLGNIYSFSPYDLPTEGPFKVPQNTLTYQFKEFDGENWLEQYQDAGEVSTEQNPESIGQVHVRAKDKGWFDNYIERPLRKWGRSYAKRISDQTGGSEWYKQPNSVASAFFSIGPGFALEAPQLSTTYAATGKVQTPAEAMNIQNPYGAFAVNMVLDPLGGPAITKGLVKGLPAAARYATTRTPLKNAWMLNPRAYQYNLPENTMWRGLGQEGMEDAVSSGVFRSKQNVPVEYFPGSSLRLSKSFGTNPYFTPKFKTAATYGDNYLAEVPRDAANWKQRYSRTDWSQVADRPIPISEGRILQKDWLQGYRPLDNIGTPDITPSISPAMSGFVPDITNTRLYKGAFQKYPKGPLTQEEITAFKNSPAYLKSTKQHLDFINQYGDSWKLPNYMDEALANQDRNYINPELYGGKNWNNLEYYTAATLGLVYPAITSIYGLAFSPPAVKNRVLKNVGIQGPAGGLSSKDTIIDITNAPMDYAKVNQVKDGNIIIGGEFIEDANNTVRKAKDWLSATDTYSDKQYPSKDIQSFYGIENGKFKVGKANEFNPNTEIVPRRFGEVNISEAVLNGKEMRLLDNEGNPIYQNTPNTGKFILYSPSTKKSQFIYINDGKSGVTKVNNFLKKNKDAQYIHLDNGRYEYYGLNPEGLTEQDYKNYYQQDLERKGNPGYNLIIKGKGGQTNWLEQYQFAGETSTAENPETIEQVHVRARDKGWFDNYIKKPLRKFGRSYAQRISDATGGSEWYKQPNPFMNLAFESMNAPQYAATYAVTGKVQTPSEAMNIQNPYGAFAVDAVLDPTNLLGAGLLKQPVKNLGRNIVNSPNNIGNAKFYDKVVNIDSFLGEGIGELIAGRKNRKALSEGNTWLKNWIADPITQNKIENDLVWASQRSDQYGLGYQQAKSFVPNVREYPLSEQMKDLFIRKEGNIHAGNSGVSYLHNESPITRQRRLIDEQSGIAPGINMRYYGSWASRSPAIGQSVRKSSVIHEGTHDWTTNFLLNNSGQADAIKNIYSDKIKNISEEWQNLRKQGISPSQVMGKQNADLGYLANPTEVHARIMELRQLMKMTPEQSVMVTPEKAQDIIRRIENPKNAKFIDPKFLDVIDKDPKKLAALFNRLWAAPAATALGASQLEKKKYGGWLDQYQSGGENLPELNSKIDVANFYRNPLSEKYGISKNSNSGAFEYYLKSKNSPVEIVKEVAIEIPKEPTKQELLNLQIKDLESQNLRKSYIPSQSINLSSVILPEVAQKQSRLSNSIMSDIDKNFIDSEIYNQNNIPVLDPTQLPVPALEVNLPKKIANKKTSSTITLNPVQQYYADKMYKKYGKVIITDKGTNRTFYGRKKEDGTWDINSFEVLTGQNPKFNEISGLSVDELDDFKDKRGTPIGLFNLQQDPDIYGYPGLNLDGTGNIAYHITYKGKDDPYRSRLYNNNNIQDNYRSYGCINCEKPSLENLLKFVSPEDKALIINSTLGYKNNADWIKKNSPELYDELFKEKGGQVNWLEKYN